MVRIPRQLALPDAFAIPDRLEHDRFTLRMLAVTDVVKDFAAINQRVRPDGAPDPWSDTTFLHNLADLGWHETEFRMRRSFAYTVVRPDESEVIGCVYFYPPESRDHDVDVRMWHARRLGGGPRLGARADRPRLAGARLAFERPLWRDR